MADNDETPYIGGACACGAVRFRLRRLPIFVNCCHCRDYQRQTGSAFVVNAINETEEIEVLGAQTAPSRMPTESGRPHDIHRCPDCGTAVWSDYGDRPSIRFVRVGVLDEPDRLPPGVHIFTRSKLPWISLPEGAAAFEAYYDRNLVWPRESLDRWTALFG